MAEQPSRKRRIVRRAVMAAAAVAIVAVAYSLHRHLRQEWLRAEVAFAGSYYDSGDSILDRLTRWVRGETTFGSHLKLEGKQVDSEWLREHTYLEGLAIDDIVIDNTALAEPDVVKLLEHHAVGCVTIESELFTDNVARALTSMDELEGVYMGHSAVTDSGLAMLPLERLVGLSVEYSGVTSAGLQELRHCHRLGEIKLDARQLNADTASILKELPDLTIIELFGSDISNEHLMLLRGMSKLVNVCIDSDCEVDERGIEEFRKAIPTCVLFFDH